MLIEVAILGLASLVHSGQLVAGYAHPQARTAEAVIALVLVLALVSAWSHPERTRWFAVSAQGFALAGTLLGVAMIAIGVGPRTDADIVYHAVLLWVLVAGLAFAIRWRPA
ncbi:hypothetical protein J7E62_29330 [Variovorax paradoxus]|nr:hypothetical protein [Variovorax paradoxus]